MSATVLYMSMSLDGFIAGPNEGPGNGLGDGGQRASRRNERMTEAVELLESKRDADGRWPVEYRYESDFHFEMDGAEGQPSRWNTLRALRVLRWWEAA
jgi:hypothetical protein